MPSKQYGQRVGGFGDGPKKISGTVNALGQISGGVTRAAIAYEKNYEILDNLPQVNDEELIGNKTSEDLHIVACKTSAEWAELITLQSRKGEVYVYSDAAEDENGEPLPMVKIGDGNAFVVDLPFVTAVDFRITQEDIDNWNGKVSVRLEGENLIFY